MKILALRLENLASLPGPLAFDFTAEPLRDAGLFAITGPTGAGKSTLLDALCLALYGSTPRLRQAPSRDSQIDDTPDSRLTTSDPRTLLRRGTAGGYAEVDFRGRDGRRYRARWAVRRARGKADGRLQAVEQSLTDLDADRLLTAQKREFERLLPERLGLTFEQFTRAVLLAQSEFAAFLQADDNARSDLLERLTGTGEYSAISMAAYRRASAAKKALDTLEAKLADDQPAAVDVRAGLERAAKAARQALAELQEQEAALQERQRWHATDERLVRDYRHGLDDRQAAAQAWQALDAVRADRDWRRLIAPRRHALLRQAELPAEIVALEEALAETHRALADTECERAAAVQSLAQAEQAHDGASAARRRAEPELREARDFAQRLGTLEQQLSELESARRQLLARHRELVDAHRQAVEAQRRHRQRRDDWQATLGRLVGAHPSLEDARRAAQQAHDAAARRRLALDELSSRWQELQRGDESHRRLASQQQADQAKRAALLAEGQGARQHLDRAQQHLDSVTALIERSRAVRSESVARLRDSLRADAPCPVCGGLDQPWRERPPATPEAAQLAAQEAEETRQLQAAREARDASQEQRDILRGEYRAVDAALEQRAQALADAAQHLANARSALEGHPLHGELSAVDAAQRDAWLQVQRAASEAQCQRERSTLDELARAETELAPLEEALRRDELTLTRLETEKNGAEQTLGELDRQLPPLREQRESLADRLAAQLGDHADPDAWQRHLDAVQQGARDARDDAKARLHGVQQRHLRLAQQAEHETQRLDRRRQEQAVLGDELNAWRRAHPELEDATLTRLLAQSDEQMRVEEQRLDDAAEALQCATATLVERRRALLDQRRGQGLATDDSDEALLSAATDAALRRRLDELGQARDALTPRLQEAQRVRDAAAFALNDDERRRARQQADQAELEAARAEYQRWGQISELIGSADGKAFRRIAQAYNLEQLLEHANAHLVGLNRRYRLSRGGSELGLLVVDHDMGDERRSVHSLSGGETFLVSLALALGLASMASGELSIESLFIDEGFGSLDPQSLALAMEALDGLQALGRRVGVISHVQEMHERIPVQIRVEPLGNGTSRARLAGIRG